MISAIVLAAGKSIRMGQPKLLMPWGSITVIEKVIQTIQSAGIEDVLVVTNQNLSQSIPVGRITNYELRIIENSTNDEMLSSIQLGLQTLTPSSLPAAGTSPKSTTENLENYSDPSSGFGGRWEGVLICLGDQPQVQERSVRSVCEAFQKGKSNLVVPSYQMRRGHPWLVARPFWDEILKMKAPQTLRDFLNSHANEIEYVNMDNASILEDLDTPEDYLKYKPRV